MIEMLIQYTLNGRSPTKGALAQRVGASRKLTGGCVVLLGISEIQGRRGDGGSHLVAFAAHQAFISEAVHGPLRRFAHTALTHLGAPPASVLVSRYPARPFDLETALLC